MLKPSPELVDIKISRYSLVVAIAKRAREIASEKEMQGEILVEKPVDLAVDELIHHKIEIIEPSELEE